MLVWGKNLEKVSREALDRQVIELGVYLADGDQ